ncbi:MAG: hypothetical protein ACPGSO_07160 [Vicingaceae bacterium]
MNNLDKIFIASLFILLTPTYSYSQDSTFTIKWPDGKIKKEGVFVHEKKEGFWKEWNENGELIIVQEFQNDSLISIVNNEYYSHTNGLLYSKKRYNSSNVLIESRSYKYRDNNVYHATLYNNRGNKQSSGKIKNKLKEGNWTFYNEEGKFLKVKKYKNNVTPLIITPSECLERKKKYVWLSKNETIQKNNYKNSEWIKGFVILKPGNDKLKTDTVFGNISFAKNVSGNHFYKIKVQIDSNEITKLQASEVVSFSRGTEYYASGFFKDNYSFAYKIISGKASLFTNTQSSNLWAKNSVTKVSGPKLVTSVSNLNYYIKMNNSNKMILFPIGCNYDKFLPFVKKYFADDSELIELVTYKVLTSENVIEIITRYNKK